MRQQFKGRLYYNLLYIKNIKDIFDLNFNQSKLAEAGLTYGRRPDVKVQSQVIVQSSIVGPNIVKTDTKELCNLIQNFPRV